MQVWTVVQVEFNEGLASVCLWGLWRDGQGECLPGLSVEQLLGKISIEAGRILLWKAQITLCLLEAVVRFDCV